MTKNKVLVVVIGIVIMIAVVMVYFFKGQKKNLIETSYLQDNLQISNKDKFNNIAKAGELDWKIRLVNEKNPLPEDFSVELANIDNTRKFDKRAIKYLKEMLEDMKKQSITNIWIQSAYRNIEYQRVLYQKSINRYLKIGKSQEESEELTKKYINKPGTSEHNLGLAVDFNEVDEGFENTKAYKWLQENASIYGFILRYPKDKEEITGIEYEPWHWRYVGQEHAKKMNEESLCLEEYLQKYDNNK
mgnify:FL=1